MIGKNMVRAAVLLLFAAGSVCSQDAPKRESAHQDDPSVRRLDIPALRPPVDWRLLWFSSDRRIVSARVKLYRYVFPGAEPTVVAEAQSDDARLVEHLKQGLGTVQTYVPSDGYWGALSLPYGELEITTNKDSFKIYFDGRFVLSQQFVQNGNSFVSWTVARAVDDLLREKTGHGLTEKQFQGLSGEDWLKAERGNYANRTEAIRAESPKPEKLENR